MSLSDENGMADLFSGSSAHNLSILDRVTLIDIGTIIRIDADGRAYVRSNKLLNNKAVEYKDAEVIYPGNKSGAYISDIENCQCLIFIPRTCMPRLDTNMVRNNASNFDKEGIKVMPISTGKEIGVQTFFSGNTFNISNKNYSVSFEQNCLYLTYNGLRILIDNNQNIRIDRMITSEEKNGKWASYKINNDGLEVSGPNDLSFKLKADGTIEMNGSENSLVTFATLKSELNKMWNAIKSHTHSVSTTGTAVAQSGTAYAYTWTGYAGPDIDDAEATTLKTS